VSARPDDDKWRIAVVDHGPGIDAVLTGKGAAALL